MSMPEAAALLREDQIRRLLDGRLHDPHAALGTLSHSEKRWVRVLIPGADKVQLADLGTPMQRLGDSDLFQAPWPADDQRIPLLRWQDADGRTCERHDPYSFDTQLPQDALDSFNAGRHHRAWQLLGARCTCIQGITGTLFSTWAPNAERVSVVGNFNHWHGLAHPMRARGSSGVWELFVPGVEAGALYKFEIRSARDGSIRVKTDPYGRAFEMRPATAARVVSPGFYAWEDAGWQARKQDWQREPVSIYEVHLGSWLRQADGGFLNYRDLARELIPYVQKMGFTHIQLLPITEHPLDASWGYQTTGYYAPTSRHGTPDDFRGLVDACHLAGLGVYLDWVPGHFPRDDFALACFDGSSAYEHSDPRTAAHPDWGTLVFDFGRPEVRSFLISSALFWLEEMHVDGLRVDAVASMLYLDYSRAPGEWTPNRYGGNENLEAIAFLRELNAVTHREHPGSVTIAEESTSWPQVSRPVYLGGLGFSMKWNMGWMHDSLRYLGHDPIHRRYHHQDLSFGLLYAFNENFVLPLSHDEVVHGKGSLYGKMAGDPWQKMANLRLLFCYQFTYPGKKLLFMGAEFGNPWEWNENLALPRFLLEQDDRRGLQQLIGDLNRLYRDRPALHAGDFDEQGFRWIDCHDAEQSVISYRRRHGKQELVVVLNFTPVAREAYRIGVPQPGRWYERLNSDSACYAGSNVGNAGYVDSEALPWMNLPHSLSLRLPPLGALILEAMDNA